MLQYILFTLICICILLWMIIKVKYPFWNIQTEPTFTTIGDSYTENLSQFINMSLLDKICDFNSGFYVSHYDLSQQQTLFAQLITVLFT